MGDLPIDRSPWIMDQGSRMGWWSYLEIILFVITNNFNKLDYINQVCLPKNSSNHLIFQKHLLLDKSHLLPTFFQLVEGLLEVHQKDHMAKKLRDDA